MYLHVAVIPSVSLAFPEAPNLDYHTAKLILPLTAALWMDYGRRWIIKRVSRFAQLNMILCRETVQIRTF